MNFELNPLGLSPVPHGAQESEWNPNYITFTLKSHNRTFSDVPAGIEKKLKCDVRTLVRTDGIVSRQV